MSPIKVTVESVKSDGLVHLIVEVKVDDQKSTRITVETCPVLLSTHPVGILRFMITRFGLKLHICGIPRSP